MKERRHVYATPPFGVLTHANAQLRRLLDRRRQVLALLRARPRPAANEEGYRSRYAARLWALARSRHEPRRRPSDSDRPGR